MILERRYQIRLSKDAEKSFEKISRALPATGRKIQSLVDSLQYQPYSGLKLKGSDQEVRRLRAGDYRIIYEIYENLLVIVIAYIGPRGDAYK